MNNRRALIAVLFVALCAMGAESSPGVPGYFQNGTVLIISSSHQDTAWMDTPAACRKFRIEQNIMPALDMMRKDPNYTFCMECTLHLMEFLDTHPERRDEVLQRTREGRLEWGATYNQPYESWLSGEELVRQTYFGRRWILRNLPGCDSRVAFNPDPPARSLQMQQILAKAGIPYLFISRYHEGLYRWQSPDGSRVLAWSPGHYGNHLPLLNAEPNKAVPMIQAKLAEVAPYYEQRQIPATYGLINSTDFSKPVDFAPLIGLWNGAGAARIGTLRYGSMRGFFEAIDQPQARFDTLMGERPDVWVYITGPTHEWTTSLRREAARLLPAAEVFTTMACLLDGGFQAWPTARFERAWRHEIEIDHGIGGNNGHVTDEVFFREVRSARDSGRVLLDKALGSIASRIKVAAAGGTPIVVFNDLSWPRTDAVEVNLPATLKGPVRVVDANGQEVPSQEASLGVTEETNFAAASLGAKATASSSFGPEYGADKIIDGKWAVRDPYPSLGSSDKWNSAKVPGPHWVTIDFGQSRTIHRVVIRHEGVIGAFGDETRYNTCDFQIQRGDSNEGPWTDLAPCVTGNQASLTAHTLEPRPARYLRVLITRGSQPEADGLARIYEIQAFGEAQAKVRRIVFVASDVPSLGYKTYSLVSGQGPATSPVPVASPEGCENGFVRVTLAPGGIKGLYDKQRGRELLKTDRFLGGEVFTMLSVAADNRGAGTDAGEFGSVPMPVMDETFDAVARHRPQWRLVENGAVRTVYRLEQPLADTTVRQHVVLWHGFNRVDCQVELRDFNGRLWREFRMALPLALDKPHLAYEVPMGVVEIGKDEIPTTGGHAYGTLTYGEQCRDIRPREMRDFLDASDGRGGLTLSSSVSAFDWVDPTGGPASDCVLQPILLASRKSCNGTGNWYPQAGDHCYRFSLTSHSGTWRAAWREGIAANHPLLAVVGGVAAAGASLPPQMSFASLSAGSGLISTLKKAEDNDRVIARVYEIEGQTCRPTLRLFCPVQAAEHTNLIELDGRPSSVKDGALEIDLGHHAIETYQLQF
jgi:hypothetical protein